MPTQPALYDTLILGTGPAGLSTSLGLSRQSRTTLHFAGAPSTLRNHGITHSQAVLGHDHVHPHTILATSQSQLERYGTVSYAETEAVGVWKCALASWNNRVGFEVRGADGRCAQGRTLVLATGVRDIFPDVPGYATNWPRNIYQCLFCDGWERRAMRKAVWAYPAFRAQEAKMASMSLGLDKERDGEGRAKVSVLLGARFREEEVEEGLGRQVRALKGRGVVFDERRVVRFEDAGEGEEGVYVHLQDEEGEVERVFFGFVVHKPSTELKARELIDEIGLETGPGPFGLVVKTQGPMQNTNVAGVFVAGVFVAGDAGNMLTHVTTAMVSGVSAAAGVTHYLNEIDDDDALAGTGMENTVIDTEGDGTGCGVTA